MNGKFLTTCFAAACTLSAAAFAQTYPDRPVRIIQGYAAGGNADTIARVVGTEMSKELKQSFIVESQSGAGGTIAAGYVARSKPDGYTLLLATGGHAVADALYKKLSYHTVDGFHMISTITFFPFLWVVPADSKYSTLAEVLKAARSGGQSITYGTAGVGTTHHLAGELLNKSAQVKMVHVPYRGDAASVVALLGHQVDMIIAPPTAVIGYIQSGRLKALATTGPERWPTLPKVPTVAEQGVPGYDVRSWAGLMAPAGTPDSVVKVLNTAVQNALKVPAVKTRLEAMGGEAKGSTPEEMTTMVRNEVKKWGTVAAGAGIVKQ
ncbi:tripartite tricarboxylate transporter substrate binding protein [Candidimonas nitroreducens]|uniref:MFS transporter n=1 Tax=Candidimonas nitroreducens TaxID=683354 RepID=A0A225MRX1_9BURK|nr:tripartite tricarboxylate transporter substrate binding protein [Candidimonas nitroreducens]OWT64014.1 MFS transporter [Candidimonas nitroreducens]